MTAHLIIRPEDLPQVIEEIITRANEWKYRVYSNGITDPADALCDRYVTSITYSQIDFIGNTYNILHSVIGERNLGFQLECAPLPAGLLFTYAIPEPDNLWVMTLLLSLGVITDWARSEPG